MRVTEQALSLAERRAAHLLLFGVHCARTGGTARLHAHAPTSTYDILNTVCTCHTILSYRVTMVA